VSFAPGESSLPGSALLRLTPGYEPLLNAVRAGLAHATMGTGGRRVAWLVAVY
jgi:hypothetical protein